MKTQNTITLSLGTNMGDKLENLQTCIDALHTHIATIIEVSKVYETPAWGFEGEAFYNCVVTIHTHKSAHKNIKSDFKIRKRIRSN